MLHKGFSMLLDNRLYWSPAYQSLTLSARNLMWCFVSELRFTGSRKNGDFEYTNNGKVSFSESEFKKQGLGASGTYIIARNKLIETGFIEITYRGGMARGDMNTYKLLFIEGVRQVDQKWKRFPKENWQHEIPKIKDYIVGRGTRFKKKKNTLKNKTLNGTKPPKEMYPYAIKPPKELGSNS